MEEINTSKEIGDVTEIILNLHTSLDQLLELLHCGDLIYNPDREGYKALIVVTSGLKCLQDTIKKVEQKGKYYQSLIRKSNEH